MIVTGRAVLRLHQLQRARDALLASRQPERHVQGLGLLDQSRELLQPRAAELPFAVQQPAQLQRVVELADPAVEPPAVLEQGPSPDGHL